MIKQLHSQKDIVKKAKNSSSQCDLVLQLAEDKKKQLAAKRNKHTADRRVRQAANMQAKEKVEKKAAERKDRRMKDREKHHAYKEKEARGQSCRGISSEQIIAAFSNSTKKEAAKGPTGFCIDGIDPDDI